MSVRTSGHLNPWRMAWIGRRAETTRGFSRTEVIVKLLEPGKDPVAVVLDSRDAVRSRVGQPSVRLPVGGDVLRTVVCRETGPGLSAGLPFNRAASELTGHAVFGPTVLVEPGDEIY